MNGRSDERATVYPDMKLAPPDTVQAMVRHPARRCATCIHRVKRFKCQHVAEWCKVFAQFCWIARHCRKSCAGNHWTPKGSKT